MIIDQALEYTQRVANGESRNESGRWQKYPIHAFPRVVRYLRTKDIEEWRLLKTFACVLRDCAIHCAGCDGAHIFRRS